ncbi:MAG: lysophospholipid acyltransferase family protein [Acidimicrobiia bacterium]
MIHTMLRVRKLLSWIVTIPFITGFGLLLLLFDVVGRIVRPFSFRGFEWVMASLQWSLLRLFQIFGTSIEVERPDDLSPGTGYAILSNHQSMLDIVMIGGILLSNFPKYVAKKELSNWIPSISLNLKGGGNALIDRDDPRQAIRAIKEMAGTAQERGVSAVIFPEGHRSKDGNLLPFKTAGAKSMLKAADRLPVVPVVISGSWELNRLVPFTPGVKVRIAFGSPIPRNPGDESDVIRQVEEWMQSKLVSA